MSIGIDGPSGRDRKSRSATDYKTRFAQWLRHNSEHYLLEAVQAEMAADYLDRAGPVGDRTPAAFFWRHVFVPVYRLLPWPVRQRLIHAMPGSHRKSWSH